MTESKPKETPSPDRRATEPAAPGCCAPKTRDECCAPAEKPDCCGTEPAPARCGC